MEYSKLVREILVLFRLDNIADLLIIIIKKG